MLKIGLIALLAILLIASSFGAWLAFSKPEQVEQPIALMNYQSRGKFDYVVYVNPSHLLGTPSEKPGEDEFNVYYTNIIDSINIEFGYDFLADTGVKAIQSNVEIVGIVTGPSGWQKEIRLLDNTAMGSDFVINFPLELSAFDELVYNIETELGTRRVSPLGENNYDLVIQARVYVTANTESESINDTFVQPMQIKVAENTLEWSKQLTLSQRKSTGGFSYKHQGYFGYTITIKENILYGSGVTTLGSGSYQPPATIPVPPGNVYFTRIVDIMLANFSYQFLCDQPVNQLIEEVEVKAILEYPDVWSKTFVLVPKTQQSGEFRVDFAVDINSFSQLASTIRNEIDLGPATHDLTIKATVYTRAETDFGNIEEVFTHALKGTFGATALTWSDELESSKPSSIMGTQMVANPEKLGFLSLSGARTVLPTAAGILFLFCISLLILNVKYKPVPLSWIEKEAMQAAKKHKDLIIDVTELPQVGGAALAVIPMSSLDDLITTAEALLKPVLHKAETERHTYCVIDATTRYQYVSELFAARIERPGALVTSHVLRILPIDGQTDVSLDQLIEIVFDRPMEPASVEAALVVSPAVDYTTMWLEAKFILIIAPTIPLKANTTYTFEISVEAMSADGMPLEEGYSFSFTTSSLSY